MSGEIFVFGVHIIRLKIAPFPSPPAGEGGGEGGEKGAPWNED
jgi:hypothetical protein